MKFARGAEISDTVSQLLRPEWREGRRRTARGNRKVRVRRRPVVVVIADAWAATGRFLYPIVRKLALFTLILAGFAALLWGGRWLASTIVASRHFSVAAITLNPTRSVGRDEILELAGVAAGDRLLALDPDEIAARIAAHPWIAAAEVRRQLPSTLAITVIERVAAGVINLEGLYLVDERGRPFKRATMAEAAGQVVISGIDRALYLREPRVVEAAVREALGVLRTYQAGPKRPGLSEIRINGSRGFALYLYDSGTELRLGRGHFGEKLARWDRILESLAKNTPDSGRTNLGVLATVFLDGPAGSRVSLRLTQVQ